MREIKKALRKELIAKRRVMDKAIKEKADFDIFQQIKPFLDEAGCVFTYASTDIEVDTRRMISYCLENGIPVALPKCGEFELEFFYINSIEDLGRGKFDIDEPLTQYAASPDEHTLCVVPALCADGAGFRLGYGRGYYDRFLISFPGKSVILCYSAFKRHVPCELHDQKGNLTIFDRT